MSRESKFVVCFLLFFVVIFVGVFGSKFIDKTSNMFKSEDKVFRLLSSESNRVFDDDLVSYAKSKNIDLQIYHYGDLEMIDVLNNKDQKYDGVWISNSIWLYMLNNSSLVTDSKSIALSPVVMGIKKSKAQELGFVDKQVYNKDILNAVADKKLNYVMTSVTKTNTGATAYLNVLYTLAGSPEVLKSDMLKDEKLITNLKSFFKGVERVSGDEGYLKNMFLNSSYEAIIDYESSLINLNEELVNSGKEPLYLIYPEDGVALNDMPFGYINRGQSEKKKENFKILQDYLKSQEVRNKLEQDGFRTWYGGINNNPSGKFKKEWGIDTSKYLISLKYPSKDVMNEAFDLYVERLRKPTNIVFCLDVSGSMYGKGIKELTESMTYLLDREKAKVDKLQFSPDDKVTIITFDSRVKTVTSTYSGNDLSNLITFVSELNANGGTNIYDSSIEALKKLKDVDSKEYTRTVILMTDGESNSGSFRDLSNYYKELKQDIPIYSITFGEASTKQLSDIAELTNAKIFDGKSGLKQAFKEVRSYN